MGNLFVIVVNVVGMLFAGIIKLFLGFFGILWNIIGFFFNKRAAKNNVLLLNSVHTLLFDAKLNNDLIWHQTKNLTNQLASKTEKNNIKEQLELCIHIDSNLKIPIDNINQDLSNIGNSGFVFKKEKYNIVLSLLKTIKYPLSISDLNDIKKKYLGLGRFIDSILDFAEVQKVSSNLNKWVYRKNNINYALVLNESARKIAITAKSNNPISFNNRVNHTTTNSDIHKLLAFDSKNELTVNTEWHIEEVDHYDISEFFESIEKLLKKEEINAYANKKQLSYRDANEIEDEVADLLCKIKKIAPPPADYMLDDLKMHGGKQRWAQLRDTEIANMLIPKGFVIGKLGYGSLLYTGDYNSHILTIASVGSGKGVGVVIPNLIRHQGSAVVLDPKGENYLVTSNHRSKIGNKVFYYDPWEVIDDYEQINRGRVNINAIKAQINPLDLIDTNEKDIIDKAKMLAASFIVRDSDKDAFFYNEAETFIARLIVYICTAYKNGDSRRNLVELRRLLMIDKVVLIREIIAYFKANKTTTHRIVEHELLPWLDSNIQSGARSLQSIYTFAQIGTSFLMSERVSDSLKTSNIDIMSLKTNPTSLYLVLDMDKLLFTSESYRPLVRLIITTCMMGASVKESAKDKLLFMLDEVAQLGYLQYLPNLLSIYRGKGVVVWTIWQNLSQIQQYYEKEWQSIIGNCDVQQYFGVNDLDTAKMVSEKAGQTTIYEETINSSTATSRSQTDSESRGESYSNGTSDTSGNNSGYSYQGFNYTSSGGTSTSKTNSSNYTDSYNFSRSIQVGFSETFGKSLQKKVVPLITPFEVSTGNAYSVQYVFYMSKCPYPILSGKIKYYEDKDFYGEFDENLTIKK